MKLSRKNAKIVQAAIKYWAQTGLISQSTASDLNNSIDITPFDWRKAAKYSIWLAIFCFITSIFALLSDQIFLAMLAIIFGAPPLIKCLGLSGISASMFYYGILRQTRFPLKTYSNEAILFIGIITTGAAIYQLGRAMTLHDDQMHGLLFIGCLIYGVLGYYVKSNLIWVFAMLSLGSWYGAETGYMSGWGAYYLGMNYPLRFVLFGGVLTAGALAAENSTWFKELQLSTLSMGLLYLFIALWILSIFGDYGDMTSWYSAKPIELFHWSILFAIVSILAIYHGLKTDNAVTKGFGITFLFINLYTRFFEYFWNSMHKAIFFAILAASFWYIGTKAETIWSLGEKKTN